MVLGSGIRDPGSGKNLFRIPDPGVKKHPIPDPGSATLHFFYKFGHWTQSGGGGGSREPRTAIELSFSVWGGLGKPNRGRDRGETFFPDSGSDRDSDETFQISRNLGLEHVEFVCLLDSQLWFSMICISKTLHLVDRFRVSFFCGECCFSKGSSPLI